MANFTPGPWRLVKASNRTLALWGKKDSGYKRDVRIAAIDSKDDATLILAAPDLYRALAEWIELAEEGLLPTSQTDIGEGAIDQALSASRDALGKAEGIQLSVGQSSLPTANCQPPTPEAP